VWETDPDEWWRVLGTNLGGVVNGLASFVPRMLERATPSSILITGSLAGVATWPGGGPYAASKHAVVAVAEQAALSLADTQISVSVLCPALVRTGMSDDGEDAAVVAGRALEAVGSGRFAIIPEEWTDAVRRRVHDLAGGNQPSLPAPTTPAGSTGPTGRGRHLGVQPTEGDRGPASS
jgi:NAD(P)-dependent dehydrogenase (short-subunit alcohol dehydrogenase family)